MTRSKRSSYLLFLPLLTFYLSGGGKTALTTLLPTVLIFASYLLICLDQENSAEVPANIFFPALLFLGWCWIYPFRGEALYLYLQTYSKLVIYFSVALCAYWSSIEKNLECFEFTLIAIGSVESVLILLTWMRGVDPQTAGFLRNSLHSGLLLPCTIVVLLDRSLRRDASRRDRWVFTALIALNVIALVLVRSRSGLLALVAAGVYVLGKRTLKVLPAALPILGIFLFVIRDTLMVRLELDSFGIRSTMGRFSIWRAGLAASRTHPLSGFGIGNFETAFRLHQVPSKEFFQFLKSTIFAHNAVLQIAVDTGVIGLILAAVCFVAIAKRVRFSDGRNRSLIAMLIVFIMTGLFNYTIFLPFSGCLLAMTIGFLCGRNPAEGTCWSLRDRLLVPCFLGVGVLFFLLSAAISDHFLKQEQFERAAQVCPIRGDAWYSLALSSMDNPERAVSYLHKAIAWAPQDPFYWQRLALVLAAHFKENELQIGACFKAAQARAPSHAPFYVQEGFYFVSKGNFTTATDDFKKAAILEPRAPLPEYGLFVCSQSLNDVRNAATHAAKALQLKEAERTLEADPGFGSSYKEFFESPYAEFLFDVPTLTLKTFLNQIKALPLSES